MPMKKLSKLLRGSSILCVVLFWVILLLPPIRSWVRPFSLLFLSAPLMVLSILIDTKIRADRASVTKARVLFTAGWTISVLSAGLVLLWQLFRDQTIFGSFVVGSAFVTMAGVCVSMAYVTVIRRLLSKPTLQDILRSTDTTGPKGQSSRL